MIEVPEKVSSKVSQPSVPADNGVNEMRYQVARLYTALNIEVNLPVLSHGPWAMDRPIGAVDP